MTGARAPRDGRTAGLEQAIMDLYDEGNSPDQIAAALADRASKSMVTRILGYMRESTPERLWAATARAACANHAAAIAATGRDYASRQLQPQQEAIYG